MKTFRRIVLIFWILLAVFTGLLFAFPKSPPVRIEGWVLTLFVAALLTATAVYKLLRIYYAGMNRSGNSSPARRATR